MFPAIFHQSFLSANAAKELAKRAARSMSGLTGLKFETLALSNPKPFVVQVELNRPDKMNAFNIRMWAEIKQCFEKLSTNTECRAIVLSAAGKHFTAGIDIYSLLEMGQTLAEHNDIARKAKVLEPFIKDYQDSITSLELCTKPIICAVHKACIGAGVDLITAADIRYCSEDAFFQVKEVEMGLAADVGTLQRLPKAIGSQSLARELCYTARKMQSAEALSCGLVSRVLPDRETAIKTAIDVAENIAQKSPVAVQATKQNIVYSQSRPNQDGLDHIRLINKLNLQSEDFVAAATAGLTKGETPIFSKL